MSDSRRSPYHTQHPPPPPQAVGGSNPRPVRKSTQDQFLVNEDGQIDTTGMSAAEINARLFHPSLVRPLTPTRVNESDVAGIRQLLMEPNCILLTPSIKSQLTDDQIRSMIYMAGGTSSTYASLYVSYLSHSQIHFTSLHQLLEAINTLKFESQEYKIDLYLYFNKDLVSTSPPQINQKEIEILFIEGGGFLTLTILQYLSSQSSSFNSFTHLKESLHAQVPAHLLKLEGFKNNLIRFLTCTNINEFSIENTDGSSTTGSAQPLSAVFSSPLLDYKVTNDTIRHLLFIGATDVQLIYLLTKIYNALNKGNTLTPLKKIKDERKLITLVKKEWNLFLIDVSNTLDWMRSPDKNTLFVESVSEGVTQQNKVPSHVYIPHESIDGAMVEKIYIQGGLGHATLAVLKTLNSRKNAKFQTINALIVALKNQGEAIESMTKIYDYFNHPHCCLWVPTHQQRAEITEGAITALMTSLPLGTTVELVLRECFKYERYGILSREKKAAGVGAMAGGKDGVLRKPPVPILSRKPTMSDKTPGLTRFEEEFLSRMSQLNVPTQFLEWDQLSATLMSTIPQALAQLNLDRENLSITLSSVSLFLSKSTIDQPESTPGSKLAFVTRDLDSLLSIVYDAEDRQLLQSSAMSFHNKIFTLLDLLSMLRNWYANRRKFTGFPALKRAILMEIGATNAPKATTTGDVAKTPAAANEAAQQAAASSSASKSSGATPGGFSTASGLGSPLASNATRFEFPTGGTNSGGAGTSEKDILRSFLNQPSRRLLFGYDGEDGAHIFEDFELDRLLNGKNSIPTVSLLTASPSQPMSPTKGVKDVSLNGIQLFIASLKYLENHPNGSTSASSQTIGFLNLSELETAIREHYKLLAAQMIECLKYLKTSKRLFSDTRITITWNLQREILQLYTTSEADLYTLPLIRKLERDRYQETPYASLSELIEGLKQAALDAERNNKIGITEADRARVLTTLIQASQPIQTDGTEAPKPRKDTEHQPLLPLAFLDKKVADEQINTLLSEYSLFTLLQHIAILCHNLTMKATELSGSAGLTQSTAGPTLTRKASVNPAASQGSPKKGPVNHESVIPNKPAYPTWHALNLAIHESVLDFNRLRSEVFQLLSAESCTLLSLSKTPIPITYESVDRLVKACGLMHSDMLTVLQHLSDRGIRLKSLPELAARCKAFYLERRKAESQATRYGLMKDEILSYFASESCHLFLNAAAKARVQQDLDDTATFVQFMQSAGGSLKSVLSLIHALESEELAFDSLDGIIEGIRAYNAREILKKQFLPFINNANVCHLFDKPGSKFKEVTPTDKSLAVLLNIEISDLAWKEMRKWKKEKQATAAAGTAAGGASGHRPSMSVSESGASSSTTATTTTVNTTTTVDGRESPMPGAQSPSSAVDEESPSARAEMVLEFIYRMNSTSTRRFGSFKELVALVKKELEKTADAPNPLAPPTPSHKPALSGGGSMDFGVNGSPIRFGSAGGDIPNVREQYQFGYDSDDDLDPRDLPQNPFSPKSPSSTTPLSPSSASGPSPIPGLSRKGTIARPSISKGHSNLAAHLATVGGLSASGLDESGDIEETPEERAAEETRRKQRTMDKLRKEVEQLQHHGWLLKEDEEWMIIDRQNIEEPEMTLELLNERRLAIFSALSYPACLLFSNRIEPMSLSDIDLDAVLSSAGGGEKGLKIACSIIKLLDRKHAKYFWFDQVTLEIARRWQRRKAWEYLTIDPVGKKILEHTNSIPLFVLRLLIAINKSHGVDPALSAVDMLTLAHEVHPEPFHTHAELIHTIKDLVRTERRETLKAAIQTQFQDMFTTLPKLTDTKMDLLLGGVDDSLYHVLKYLELVQAEGGRNFVDILDLVPIITSLHSREKSGIPDAFSDELEEEDEDAELEAEETISKKGQADDSVMLRRQKIFMALSFPKCTLFTAKTKEPFTLTDVDLDDVVKAGNNRVSYALKTLTVMDKTEKLKFKSFYAAVLELAHRCQTHHASNFLASHENKLFHHSVALPREGAEMTALVERLLVEGMVHPDPYLSVIACLKALNQVPKVLAQSPPPGGYRSVDELIVNLKSLANEQRVWMVKSYFNQTTLNILITDPETKQQTKPEPTALTDFLIASLLHSCSNSIYFVLRHLQTLELTASAQSTVFDGYEPVLQAVAALHLKLLENDPTLKSHYEPSSAPIGTIAKPNEDKQMKLAEQRALAASQGLTLDKASRDQILLGVDPNGTKIHAAALALIEYEKIEAQVFQRSLAELQSKSLSSDAKFLSDARFQLLSILSFPKSNLFAKCIHAVSITDHDLDTIFRSTFTSIEEDSANEMKLEAIQRGEMSWLPTQSQVTEAIRMIKYFDSNHYQFKSFQQFLSEYRAYFLQQKRDILLSHLFYPKCQLFTSCTRQVEIEDRELDLLLCLPKKVPTDVSPHIPLGRIIEVIQELDGAGTKVYSFIELVDAVKQQLAQSQP